MHADSSSLKDILSFLFLQIALSPVIKILSRKVLCYSIIGTEHGRDNKGMEQKFYTQSEICLKGFVNFFIQHLPRTINFGLFHHFTVLPVKPQH